MTEAEIQNRLRVLASDLGCRLFRNQVGSYELADGRRLSSGLCKGSSDLIGWTPTIITPDMVGGRVAVFTAVEVKGASGRPTREQLLFIEAVKDAGGIGVIARRERDLTEALTTKNTGRTLR